MRKQHATGIRLGDGIAIACVLLLAVFALALSLVRASVPAVSVEIITEDTRTVYPLSENREIPIASAGHSLILTVKDRAVSVTETDCPSGICAATGWISGVGQSIVCAPARVLVKIVGEEGDHGKDADIILP